MPSTPIRSSNVTVPAVPVSIPLVKGLPLTRPSVEFSDQTYSPADGGLTNRSLPVRTLTWRRKPLLPRTVPHVWVAEIHPSCTRSRDLEQFSHEPLRAPRAISTFLGCKCWIDHFVGDSWFVVLRFNVVRV